MLESLIIRWGYLAIGVGTFFEGEAILVLAGGLAHRGLLSLPFVILAAFVGSVVGDQLWFQLGRRYGRALIERRPAWKARADTAQGRIDRYGDWFVFGFRFLYGIRTVTPVLLGVSRYSRVKFLCLNLAGAALWAVVLGSAGYAFGAALARVLQRAAHVEELILASAAFAFAVWFVVTRISRLRSGPDEKPCARDTDQNQSPPAR